MLSPSLVKVLLNTDRTGDCWLWTGSCLQSGYAQGRFDKKNKRVHRVTYEMAYGPMVCVCPEPDCTPLGECRACRRKPLALMAVNR